VSTSARRCRRAGRAPTIVEFPRPGGSPGLEAARDDALFFAGVLYGEGVAAVEWLDLLLPAAGDGVLPIALRVMPGGGRAIRSVLTAIV